MGFMDKVKDFVAPVEEDDVTESYEKEVQAAPVMQSANRYEQTRKQSNANALDSHTKMVLFEPRSFGESEEIGRRLVEGRAVVVNLHKLDTLFAQRTIDFLAGVVFALDGTIQKVGPNVILCSPHEIQVSGTITLKDDEAADAGEEVLI